MEDIIPEIKREYIMSLLEQGKRIDDRGFDDYRDISIETDFIEKAEGSARVKFGKTQIVVGVKLTLGAPFSDMPNSGVLTTNVELVPIASPSFELGPPGEDSVEIARVVDRVIRESDCIDIGKLCLKEGEKVWIVFVDIHVLDYGGNLFDAAALGSIAALMTTTFPAVDENGTVDYKTKTDEKLPVVGKPVEVTFVKLGDYILVDPCLDEEEVLSARLTIGYNSNGNVVAMQKGGSGTFTQKEIVELVNRGREKAEELRTFLE